MNMIVTVLLIIILIQLLFYSILGYVGLLKVKRNYEIVEDKLKFLFLVPACNEDQVIKETLQELKKLNYEKGLYEVHCLVNNSTDKTFEVAKSEIDGVYKLDSEVGEPKGKPYVLEKYFDRNVEWENFDYIIILDADNIISPNFLKEMNSQILKYGADNIQVVQGYLGIKNISTSMMSLGYAASYFVANRTIQLAKSKLRWNSTIGGTGFALSVKYLQKHGWNPKSYTEDFELQVELSVKGEKSLWNHFAIVYDEKPNTVLASHNQRLRWAQGHWRIAFTSFFKQIKSLFNIKSLKYFPSKIEVLIYSFAMMRAPITIIVIMLAVIEVKYLNNVPIIWTMLPLWLFCEVTNYFIFPIICILLEGKNILKTENKSWKNIILFLKIYIAFFYSAIVYVAAQTQGLVTCFLPQNNWNKTEHSMKKHVVVEKGE
ncbi:MAG: glycosyltransferase family 2 protein [Sarcina sp.]